MYGAALVTLLVLVALTKAPLLPQSPREFPIFAALAVGPMLVGHTGMNWALGHLPAYVVNLTVLGEPIGATLLAAIIPGIGEVPGPGVLVGGAIVLLGVYLTARKQWRVRIGVERTVILRGAHDSIFERGAVRSAFPRQSEGRVAFVTRCNCDARWRC